MTAFGDQTARSLLRARATARRASVSELIGGADALQFLLTGQPKAQTTDFLTDYARILAALGKTDLRPSAAKIRDYFLHLSALMQLGVRKPDEVAISFSLADTKSKHRTEEALKILGLKIERKNKKLLIRSIEKKSQAGKQELLASLAVDAGAIEEALAARKTYTLQIPIDHIAIFPAESVWKDAFFERSSSRAGSSRPLQRTSVCRASTSR